MKEIPLILYAAAAGPSSQDLSLSNSQSTIISKHPQQLSTSHQFPVNAHHFVFPNGINFTPQHSSELQTHQFNFPNVHGRQFFGLSTVFKLRVDILIHSELINKGLVNEDGELFCEHGITLLMSEPIQQQFVQFLEYYANKILLNELELNQVPEIIMSHFQNRKLPLHVVYGDVGSSLTQKSEQKEIKINGVMTNGASVFQHTGLIFKKMPPSMIVDIIEYLLQEKTVVITGNNQMQNAQAVYEILALMYPFNYPYPYYGTLPKQYMQLIHAPVPAFCGIPSACLENEVLPQQCVLFDISVPKQIQHNEYLNYHVKTRTSIPRTAINKLNCEFQYKLPNKQAKPLQNTMNYKGSDPLILPDNVSVKIAVEIQKSSFFSKKTEIEYQDITYQYKSVDTSASANTSMMFDSQCVKHITPFWMTGKQLAFVIEVNERLFHYSAMLDLARDARASVINQIQEVKKSGFKGLLYALNKPVVKTDYISQKKLVFKADPYPGFNVFARPKLPTEIRNLLILIIEQNANQYGKKTNAVSSPCRLQSVDQMEINDDEEVQDLLPHPISMLYDAKIQKREARQFQLQSYFQEEERDLDSALTLVDQQFNPVGCNIGKINQFTKEKVCTHVKNTTQDLHPSGKSIDVARVRVGFCAVFLQMVGHFRKSLYTQFRNTTQKPKEPTTNVVNSQVTVSSRNKYQINISGDSQKICMGLNLQNDGYHQMYQDLFKRYFEQEKKDYQVPVESPYIKILDFTTFIAETPTAYRPFVDYFCRTPFFSAFLEARLSDSIQFEGSTIQSYAHGKLYSAQYQDMCQSSMFAGSSFAPNYSLTVIGRPSMENQSQSSDSRADSPMKYRSESDPDGAAPIEFARAKDDHMDLADAILRHQLMLTEAECSLFSSPTQFLIQKLNAAHEQKWVTRIVVVKQIQQNTVLEWREGDIVKATMRLSSTEVPEVPVFKSEFPTPYPVSIYGHIKDEKTGREVSRKLELCFQNATEQRHFLILVRPLNKTPHRERVAEGIANNKLVNGRKARRYAIGVLQANLEVGGDVLTWIYENCGIE
ncbi:DENN-domain-containing_protein [Hexamita inflata]|uniref:DENN-domain-containing_protein n=1 Tax=Hexamita inflata TaxID=28002 RepID=A0ABP1I0C3_9EUKA